MRIFQKNLHFVQIFLVVAAPVIFLWARNFAEVMLREVAVTLGALLVLSVVVFGIFWTFYRDTHKAVTVTSVSLLLVLFYQDIFFNNLLWDVMRHRLAFLLSVTIIFSVAYFVQRTKRDLLQINKTVTVILGIFIFLSLLQLAGDYYTAYNQKKAPRVETVATGDIKELRNIYYIILDEHTSSDVLTNVLGYPEIKQTVTELESRGFYVAEKSNSNYPATHLSLPSALNLRYVDEYMGNGAEPLKILTEMMQNHFLKDFLHPYGYRYLHFGADWTTHLNPYADENINYGLFSPFQAALWKTTAFAPVEEALRGHGPVGSELSLLHLDALDSRFTQWKRIQFQLQELGKVPDRKDGPFFVFAHLLIPHEPYVFDANGNFVTKEESDSRTQKENYLGQVAYIDKEIVKLVDKLQKSDPKPIIIIQGDHGHKFPVYDKDRLQREYGLTPEQAAPLMTRIFNVYYLPDGGNKLLYETITPVNSFRIVLDKYFGQKFGLLKDVSHTFDPNNGEVLMPD